MPRQIIHIPQSVSNRHLPPPSVDYAAMPRDEQVRRCNAIDEIGLLIAEFGLESVQRWVKYHAWSAGKDAS